ncbi:MAG: hypothetical protein A2168_07355 [Planctomycetes bacterium RBG_13_50_24]|nr:MAG: hypothetical protein A2168_07355 [Planctomycetes bacterium RBG_13_50_24]
MKAKNIILTIAMVLVWAGTTLATETDSNDARPYIGVMLDATPLPDLLVKHLGLEPSQGIRIANIHRDSPADKAGLERDDIIIGFEGGLVDDRQQFVDNVRKAGIGTEISLEIIHLGKRNTVKLTLEGLKGDFDLKYPPEPEVVQSWRPGKIFKLKPGDEDWMEVFKDNFHMDNLPSDIDVNIKKFFKEIYTYKHSDGEDYTITIEGNPNDVESTITVVVGENEYKTTLKEIDKLPEKYQEPAEQAVKDARTAAKTRKFYKGFDPQSFDWKPYLDKMRPDFEAPFGPGDEMFDAIKKQMKELQQRLDKIEKWRKDKFDSEEPVEPEKQQQKDLLQRDKDNEHRA